ncbi:MAG: hypothetical protein ACK5OB_00290 [Pirellula sp.]|jgi:hypothetical protein
MSKTPLSGSAIVSRETHRTFLQSWDQGTAMTLSEYKEKVRKHNMMAGLWIAGLFLGAIILLSAAVVLVATNRELRPIAIGSLVAYVSFVLFNFYRIENYYRKIPGLVCEHCDATLARPKSIVIATGSCPTCGERVLDDHWVTTRKREYRSRASGSVVNQSN